ncbi:MAG: ribonuclease HII [Cystobacterineae bacterium]|nr:ribonuclease HII [Cystobacterineae bacterium]
METEDERLESMLIHEKALWSESLLYIAGVDEAGMAPLAGPVVAAAVVLPQNFRLHGVKDSKKISTEAKRERLASQIRELCLAQATAQASVEEIDALNIYQAGRLAMQRAVLALSIIPQHCLVDARHLDKLPCPQTALIQGDNLSLSIAAASILAKTSRDNLLKTLAQTYPQYGFERHKGYPTAQHLALLKKFGPSPVHRKSFSPVAKLLPLPLL